MPIKVAWADVQVDEKRRYILPVELNCLFDDKLFVVGSPDGIILVKEEEMEYFNILLLSLNLPFQEERRKIRSLFSGSFYQDIDDYRRIIIPEKVLFSAF
ncbi:MAG: hypothetical protein ABID67_00395 [Candidatus Nealsonbacteria bacterium]